MVLARGKHIITEGLFLHFFDCLGLEIYGGLGIPFWTSSYLKSDWKYPSPTLIPETEMN